MTRTQNGSFGEASIQWRQESEPNQNNKGMAKMRQCESAPTNSPGKKPGRKPEQQQNHTLVTLVVAHAPPHGDEPEV